MVFDIEELNKYLRERLRDKLRELGFGMLQRSVFISPYDILSDLSEFLEEAGLSSWVYLLEVSHIVAGDERELAEKVWDLDKLNNEYKEILERIEEIKNSHFKKISDRRKKS